MVQIPFKPNLKTSLTSSHFYFIFAAEEGSGIANLSLPHKAQFLLSLGQFSIKFRKKQGIQG
jgi:hypothetical protein